MNAFDIVLLLVLSVFAGIGVLRGFVRTTLFLANWVVASVVAWFLSTSVSDALEKAIDEPMVRMLVAFVVTFLVAFLVGLVTTSFLHKLVESTTILKFSNRLLGGLAGAAVGVAVVVVVFLLAGLTSLPSNGWWRHAYLTPFFESIASFVVDFLPSDIARHIRYG